MQYMKLVIIFGNSGAGKSYIADILEKKFGYFSYNGDLSLPKDMKEEILKRSDVTVDMRRRFVKNILDKVKLLAKNHEKIVIHQALIKEYMREQILQEYPDTKFIWAVCDEEILKKRYMKRSYFNLGLEYLKVMINAFEEPKHLHYIIRNDSDGSAGIIKQLKKVNQDI
jgi:gluconate kinase